MTPHDNGCHHIAPLEPIAIIGMGCRLPGGLDSVEDFWDFLVAGGDAVGDLPPQRWQHHESAGPRNAHAMRATTRRGGFLDDAAAFDADFFGITPREGELMDPQQRIMLEVSWQALEHAGVPPGDLAGTDTGVFVGVGSDDYGRQMLENLPSVEAWTGIGGAMCGVPNRVSYLLDLRGPSLAVDTACSASLVAIHLACQSLRARESTLALAAGVNLIAAPGLTMVLDAAGATAPDGRSKSFSAAADGYGRGEGCGVLVLKRLSNAVHDGDRVIAVVRGSAVNQDGRTNGIMAPNGAAQEHVIRQALRQADVDAISVDYVEAHGTGTRMGDPLELDALGAVYGRAGTPRPCLVGSVKANIGHLEAGAGVAGVIKAALAVHHGEIPPTPRVGELNPAVDWDSSGLRVVTEAESWPVHHGPRRAGVSSFGYGGTVGHVILEQAPTEATTSQTARMVPHADDRPLLFPLSGASARAVRDHAGALADWLAGMGAGTALTDLAHTLSVRRTHLPHRTAIVATGRADLVDRLRQGAFDTARAGGNADPVWVFSGHGAQWVGMGRELMTDDDNFAATIDALAPVFEHESGFDPRDALYTNDLTNVHEIQPLIYAVQVALAAMWRAHGVRPAAVIGHSVGEIAAAVVAGAFSAGDGARIICRRSNLLRRVAGQGAMAMVPLPAADVEKRLGGRTDVVAAIFSSPNTTVVSGTPGAVRELTDEWQRDGIPVRPVASDVAFHSGQMDRLLPHLVEAVDGIPPLVPSVPVYGTALPDVRTRPRYDGTYWAENLRNPVRLADAVTAAIEDGHRYFVEVSAHPVVTHSIDDTASTLGVTDLFVGGTLRRHRPERETFLANLAALHCHGGTVRWADACAGNLVTVPRVAWQHKRFWFTPVVDDGATAQRHDIGSHTLLGPPLTVAGAPDLHLWQTRLDDDNRPYPGGHAIQGVEIMPAAVLLQTLLTAGGEPALHDVALRVPLAVDTPRDIQVVARDAAIRLASRLAGGAAWTTHTTAATGAGKIEPHERTDVDALRAAYPTHRDPGAVTALLTRVGVAGVGFDWRVDTLSAGPDGVLATVTAQSTTWAPLLDVVLSIAPQVFPGEPLLRTPAYVRWLAVADEPPPTALVQVRRRDGESVDVVVTDPDGVVAARITGLRFGLLDGTREGATDPHRLLQRIAWPTVAAAPSPDTRPRPVVLLGSGGLADALRDRFTAAGLDVQVRLDLRDTPLTGTDVVVLPPEPDDPTVDPAAAAWRVVSAAHAVADVDGTRLWAVSTGVRESATPESLAQAPVWGVGRIVAAELPYRWAAVVDLPAEPTEPDLEMVPTLLRAGAPGDDVLSVRSGTVATQRLLPSVTGSGRAGARRCRADAGYLITGGLGALGLQVADWLVSRGARHLILAGRTALPDRDDWDAVTDPVARGRIDAIRALEAVGATVHTVAVDIGDADAVRARLNSDLPPVRGVVHAAGTFTGRALGDVDRSGLATAMHAKVSGARTLHELYPPGTLDFLVLFSSNGYLLGLPGQAGYAAANAYLDALARHRPGDTTSLAWTAWRGTGMGANDIVEGELRDRGSRGISAAEAFAAWELASELAPGLAEPNLAVMPTVACGSGTRVPAIMSELDFPEPASDDADGIPADLDGADLREHLITGIAVDVGAEMRIPPSDLDIARPLPELGLDSVMTVSIRRKLEKRFGIGLPATVLWTHQTVTAVADHIAERLSRA